MTAPTARQDRGQIGERRDIGRVLVTGAAGFLGSAVITAFRAAKLDVVATDIGPDTPGRARMTPCDVTDPDQVDTVVGLGAFDTILHCGAVSGPMVMPDRPLDIWRINSGGTANVLEAARRHGVGRVVVCSTTEVYGDLTGRVDEATMPKPASVYGASKLAGEQAMMGYVREHGLDAMALRLSWIYGPGRQTPTTLDRLIRATLSGRNSATSTPADTFTHYLHIEDAVQGLVRAATITECRSKIFNITSGRGVVMSDVAEAIMKLQPGVDVSCGPPDPSLRGISEIDNSLAAREIGFEPRVSLADGLARFRVALEIGGDGR